MTTTPIPGIDLDKLEKYMAESKAYGLVTTAIRNTDLEALIDLARRASTSTPACQASAAGAGSEPSGNTGELAASDDLPPLPDPITKVTEVPGYKFTSSGYSDEQMHAYAQLARQRQVEPHAQAEPVPKYVHELERIAQSWDGADGQTP